MRAARLEEGRRRRNPIIVPPDVCMEGKDLSQNFIKELNFKWQ